MANIIKTLVSEVAIWEEIIKSFLKNRVIEQTAFYLGKGADHYYSPNKTSSGDKYNYPKIAQLLENVLTPKKGAKTAIISLGCGNCEKDKKILEHLQQAGYPFSFFGIDSSMAMLQKAGATLNDVAFETQLICADFGALSFRKDLDKIIGEYEVKIFLFLDNTFGNLNQSHIANVFDNMLHPGDHLLLDVAGFKTITTLTQANLFKRYLQYVENPFEIEFRLGPLKALGIPEENGKLTLEIAIDDATKARVFTFGFKITRFTIFELEGETIKLSDNERIHLIYILIYDLDKLTQFLEERDFKLQNQVIGEFVNQLLFKKQ